MEGVRRSIQAQAKTESLVPGVACLSVETQSVFRTVVALGVRAQSPLATVGDNDHRVWIMVLYPASAASDVVKVKAELARALEGAGLTSLLYAKASKDALDLLLKANA